ncbi:MAG TPA: porin [Pirellulales bacterium]|nr:porin [Pirellulales bacterium]
MPAPWWGSPRPARVAATGSPVPPLTFPASRETLVAPPSPAQHFAEMADLELSLPASPVEFAAYNQSLSESGGADALNTLNRRPPGSVQQQKNQPGQAGGGMDVRPPGSVQQQKNAAKAKSADDEGFEHNVFGRIQADTVTFGQGASNIKQVGHAPNGTDFRRARIGVQGTGYDVYFYRFEVDFSQLDQVVAQVPRITDAYAEIRQLGYAGTLRMGEFRVPFSSERLMSANDLTFIERGLPQAFNPARQLGLMLFNSTPNYLASYYSALQTFQATDEGEQFGKAGRFDFTQRFVFLPWYDEPSKGRYLFHFGGAYQYQNARNNAVKYSTTPEATLTYFTTKNLIPNFITTPSIITRDVQIAQVEASTVLGPLSFQGEYYATWVDPTATGRPFFFHGAYVYASYFLTGEHRVYSRDQGYYTSVTPFTNFFRVKGSDGKIVQGSGAWEIAARFSSMNLSDKSIQGGRLNDVTLGVNWYLTRQMKVMANYIYAMNNVQNKQTYANIVETRCQVVW